MKTKIKKSVVKSLGWAVKKWSKRYLLFFLAMILHNRLRQKRCLRSKFVGVKEEIFEKVIIEGVTSISKS